MKSVKNTQYKIDRTPKLNPVQVKIELLKRDDNIYRWAIRNGYHATNVWRAINRGHRGRISKRIAEELKEELGL